METSDRLKLGKGGISIGYRKVDIESPSTEMSRVMERLHPVEAPKGVKKFTKVLSLLKESQDSLIATQESILHNQSLIISNQEKSLSSILELKLLISAIVPSIESILLKSFHTNQELDKAIIVYLDKINRDNIDNYNTIVGLLEAIVHPKVEILEPIEISKWNRVKGFIRKYLR